MAKLTGDAAKAWLMVHADGRGVVSGAVEDTVHSGTRRALLSSGFLRLEPWTPERDGWYVVTELEAAAELCRCCDRELPAGRSDVCSDGCGAELEAQRAERDLAGWQEEGHDRPDDPNVRLAAHRGRQITIEKWHERGTSRALFTASVVGFFRPGTDQSDAIATEPSFDAALDSARAQIDARVVLKVAHGQRGEAWITYADKPGNPAYFDNREGLDLDGIVDMLRACGNDIDALRADEQREIAELDAAAGL